MPAVSMELSQNQNNSSLSKSKSQEHLQKALSPSQPQYKRPLKSTYKHHADIHKVDTSTVFTRSWENFGSHLSNSQQQNFVQPTNVPFQSQQNHHFNQPPQPSTTVVPPQVPLISSDQQANRQAMLEQLRIQEQQQLAKLMATNPSPKPEIFVQPNKPTFNAPPPVPVEDKNKNHPHHHDILRQHNEEYRVLQAKKSAVQMANTRYGYYSSHDSNHFNFIVPIIPSLQALNAETMEKNENTVS